MFSFPNGFQTIQLPSKERKQRMLKFNIHKIWRLMICAKKGLDYVGLCCVLLVEHSNWHCLTCLSLSSMTSTKCWVWVMIIMLDSSSDSWQGGGVSEHCSESGENCVMLMSGLVVSCSVPDAGVQVVDRIFGAFWTKIFYLNH